MVFCNSVHVIIHRPFPKREIQSFKARDSYFRLLSLMVKKPVTGPRSALILVGEVMHLRIGEIVHHGTTQEKGRIVRFFRLDKRVGYIVATARWGSETEIEQLWFPREIKEIRERLERYRPNTPRLGAN